MKTSILAIILTSLMCGIGAIDGGAIDGSAIDNNENISETCDSTPPPSIANGATNASYDADTIVIGGSHGYQVITGREDIRIAEEIMASLLPYRESTSTGDLVACAAMRLLGTPYVAGTLEEGSREYIRIYLTKTDCILFAETCVNLALTVKLYGSDYSFEKFADLVRQSRYRNGRAVNYSDRIHYTTEWIRQGEERGILTDLSESLGGSIYKHPIYYMSKNYKKYDHLKDADPLLSDCCENDSNNLSNSTERASYDLHVIKNVEEKLNETPFWYIPKGKISEIEGSIRSGDIIGYLSGVDGLDIAHVAIAYVTGDKVGFIHASQSDMKVVVDKKSINDYVNSRSSTPGIAIVRLK